MPKPLFYIMKIATTPQPETLEAILAGFEYEPISAITVARMEDALSAFWYRSFQRGELRQPLRPLVLIALHAREACVFNMPEHQSEYDLMYSQIFLTSRWKRDLPAIVGQLSQRCPQFFEKDQDKLWEPN